MTTNSRKHRDPVAQLAYIRLGDLEPYHDLTAPDAVPPQWIGNAGLADDESMVGVYIPVPGEPTEAIVVTNRGLRVEHDGAWIFICYDELDDISLPREFWGEGKLNMTWFSVTLTNGQVVKISIRKHHVKFSDIPQFMRFLIGVRGAAHRGTIRVE